MKTTGKHLGAIGAVLTAVVLAAGAAAWACTTASYIELSPKAGPPGSLVDVTARKGGTGPVSIRWNSVDGPELATATGPSFSARVRIPADAQPGVAIIMAVQQGSEVGKASFEVTPGTHSGGDARSDPALTSGSEPGSTNGSASAGTNPAAAAATGGTVEEEAVTSAGQATSSETESATPGASSAPGATPSVASSAAASSTAQAATAARSATPAPGAAGGSSAATAPVAPGAVGAAAPEAAKPVSAATTANDLWSGFASGEFRGAALDDHAQASTPTSPLVVSALALATGLAAMMAGFGVAEARRRRAVSAA